MASGRPDISHLHSLLVLNISFRTTAADLRERFEIYGELGDVYVPRGSGGVSRGYAFVRFIDKEEAEKARVNMDKKMVDGREIGVQIAKYGRPPAGVSAQQRRRSRSSPPPLHSGFAPPTRRYSSPPTRRYPPSPPSRRDYDRHYDRDRFDRNRSPPPVRPYDRRDSRDISPPRKRNRIDDPPSYRYNNSSSAEYQRRYDDADRRFRRDAPDRRGPAPDRYRYDDRRSNNNNIAHDGDRRPANYDDHRRFKKEHPDEEERAYTKERGNERERAPADNKRGDDRERAPLEKNYRGDDRERSYEGGDERRYKREGEESGGRNKEPGLVVDSPISTAATTTTGRTWRGHAHADEASY